MPRQAPPRLLSVLSLLWLGLNGVTAHARDLELVRKPVARPVVSTAPVRGELLVGLAEGVDGSGWADLVTSVEARDLERIEPLRIHRIRVRPGSEGRILDRLARDPRVRFVERNRTHTLHVRPDDFLYQGFNGANADLQRWVFNGRGPDRNLDAEVAWDLTTGRADVVVAIIDSGVDLDHPELEANLWTNPGEVPDNGLDDDLNGFVDDVNGWDFFSDDADPNPDLGDGIDNDGRDGADSNTFHGTFVASCVAAVGNNGRAITGATWGCRILPLKVVGDDGSATAFRVAGALTYAAENGAHVVNLSFGGAPSSTLEAAVEFARNAGLVLVASAGNDNGTAATFPAAYDGVISVGASDSGLVFTGGSGDLDGRAAFTDYGPAAVDVVAPGVDLVGAAVYSVADENLGLGTTGESAFFLGSGTSFAAPLVSGLAALVRSRALDLGTNLTNDGVVALIEGTAVDLPNDPGDVPNGGADWDGRGRVNFASAVAAVPGPQNAPPTAHAGDDRVAECTSFSGVEVELDGTGSSDPEMDPLTYAWSGDGIAFDDPASARPRAVFPAGTTAVTLLVTDPGGGADTDEVLVTVQDTTPPTIQCPEETVVECGSTAGTPVTFTVIALDLCDPAPNIVSIPASGSLFPPGITTVTSTATDTAGNENVCSFLVTVVDTTAPDLTCPTAVQAECAGLAGTPVTFSVSAVDLCDPDPRVVCVPVSGSLFPPGVTQVSCRAQDGAGNQASCVFDVVVTDSVAPSIVCPGDLTVGADRPDGAMVEFSVTASDGCDPAPTLFCFPPSGSVFPPGDTVVDCTATDEAGNMDSCQFTITVVEDMIACRAGNVNGGVGAITDVVFLNGTAGDPAERRVTVTLTEPVVLSVAAPPSAGSDPAPFALYVWPGSPTSATIKELPFGIGRICFPVPLTARCSPQPLRIVNTIGFPGFLGEEDWPFPTGPAPFDVLDVPAVGRPLTLFFQGLILDAGSPQGQIAVTNGLLFVAE